MSSSRAWCMRMVLALAISGCGSSSKATSDAPKPGGDAAVVDAVKPIDADLACVAPGFVGSAETPLVVNMTAATIDDLTGTPVANVETFVCGINISSEVGHTNGSGFINQTGDGLSYKLPAFKFGDAVTEPLLLIPLIVASSSLSTLHTSLFPATGATMTAGQTATSGDITLTFAANATIAIDTLVYVDANAQQLRAVTLPTADENAVLANAPAGIAQLYGIAPTDTLVCPPAKLTVPNTNGFPANASVEFYLQGDDTGQQWAPYAQWARLSYGTVSADGMTISTTPDGGLPILGTIGIRIAP